MDGLQSELGAETRRREEAELHVEEKDAELAGALARLGEYERVMIYKYAHIYKTCIPYSGIFSRNPIFTVFYD